MTMLAVFLTLWWQVATPPPAAVPAPPPPNFAWVAWGTPAVIVLVSLLAFIWLRWRETHDAD